MIKLMSEGLVMESKARNSLMALTAAVALGVSPLALSIDYTLDENGKRSSLISDDASPILDESVVPTRPTRLEWGGPGFLNTGVIEPGYELPTGLVVQPSLLIFGNYRSALQTFKNPIGPGGDQQFTEWANRLDVFANLQLAPTERILLGIQAFHDRDLPATYSGYNFKPNQDATGRGDEGWVNEFNFDVTTLYFEGDLGEIFPNLDPEDFGSLDLGFAVGRQPLFYQEGTLINDTIDAIGVIRNNLVIEGGSNLQFSALYGWSEINRADNVEAKDNLEIWGFFTQADLQKSTVNLDLVYTNDTSSADNDGFHWGASAIQRIGHLSTAFHVLGSHTVGKKLPAAGRPVAAVNDGYLLFSETSMVLPWSDDNMYFNAWWAIDQFSSAARGPDVGGPLGRIGLAYASQGLGRYTPAISNQAEDAYGFALGWQHFMNNGFREQILLELSARDSTLNNGDTQVAAVARYQRAFGQRTVLQFDAFYSYTDAERAGVEVSHDGYGLRSQISVNF